MSENLKSPFSQKQADSFERCITRTTNQQDVQQDYKDSRDDNHINRARQHNSYRSRIVPNLLPFESVRARKIRILVVQFVDWISEAPQFVPRPFEEKKSKDGIADYQDIVPCHVLLV